MRQSVFLFLCVRETREASGILVLYITMRAGVSERLNDLEMDHPTNVCLIIAWELFRSIYVTALLRVSC